MKSRIWMLITALPLFAALAMPVGMAAQDSPPQDHKPKHHQYKLVDMGTFGGPSSYFIFIGARSLTNSGIASGIADTSTPDPYAPNCLTDCFVPHPFVWQDGILTDLGALPGVNGSLPNDINARGVVTGISENGTIDPLTGFPEFDAVIWQNGHIVNLGTFGGNFSYANMINNRGQVAGFALNTTLDSFGLEEWCMNPPFGQQMRAFIWQGGALQNLGTLGGPDSCALYINESGQATGHSFTDSVVNPITGFPTTHPFLWNGRRMLDLGTLGGTFAVANGINNRSQVIGQSNVAGDLTFHPFLWSQGGITDLGTLGGSTGTANWINDGGAVVGKADLPGSQTHDGFVWKKGVLTDLGTVDGDACSNALRINSNAQIVGCSSDCISCLHAFLWENGGPIVDLNTLIPPGSSATLTEATFVNDRGEIAAQGTLPNGDTHAFLLIPCDEKHPGECEDYSMIEATQQTGPSTAIKQGSESLLSPVERFRSMMRQRYHMPGQPAAPRD